MDLFALASQKNAWLSARLGVIAANVANAATPGYRAREVVPFRVVLENEGLQMARTHAAHFNLLGAEGPARPETREIVDARKSHSGNTVALEDELMKGAESVRAYRLNTSLVRTFHRMVLQALKDGL
ncbi:flagellar basal body protein [Thermopetrobacter sp. TC1]|uniref:flagellar basal body protein n=1 Tax=Thermopetrobacter sp. TC1 TaxID=1495045 RepID=UPI00056DAD56|nr:flagellar basal body protein [Thermopetrobacter sp. TC1]